MKRDPYIVMNWEWDWAGLKGVRQPTASELIRGICSHIHNLNMTPSGVIGYYGVDGFACMLRFHRNPQRPAKVKVWEHGKSMVSEAGYERPQAMDAAHKLWARYARFCVYMRETRHAWKFEREVGYADNSTEHEYRSQLTGEIRRKQIVAAHGDLCF